MGSFREKIANIACNLVRLSFTDQPNLRSQRWCNNFRKTRHCTGILNITFKCWFDRFDDFLTLASSAFFMLIRRWILASPRSICAIIFSISVISSFRSQNTAEYARTSSGVLPSTSWQMLSKSSRPYFSHALMNWLNSRFDQFVKP